MSERLAVEVELPSGETVWVELPAGYRRGMSFREFCAMNGNSKPDESWLPEDVAAWFLDARVDEEERS